MTSAFLNASASPPNLVLLLLNYTLPKCTLVAWKKGEVVPQASLYNSLQKEAFLRLTTDMRCTGT